MRALSTLLAVPVAAVVFLCTPDASAQATQQGPAKANANGKPPGVNVATAAKSGQGQCAAAAASSGNTAIASASQSPPSASTSTPSVPNSSGQTGPTSAQLCFKFSTPMAGATGTINVAVTINGLDIGLNLNVAGLNGVQIAELIFNALAEEAAANGVDLGLQINFLTGTVQCQLLGSGAIAVANQGSDANVGFTAHTTTTGPCP